MEGTVSLCGSGDGQIADTYINPSDPRMGFRRWVCYFNLKRDQQVELLGLVIPQFGCADRSPLVQQCHMLAITGIGHDNTPIKGQDTHLLLCLEAVVPLIIVGQRGRNVLGSFIQSLVAFLGFACRRAAAFCLMTVSRAFCRWLLPDGGRYRPSVQEAVDRTYFIVHVILQAQLVAHLAMFKRVPRDRVQGITIHQLRGSQCLELFGSYAV